VNQQTNHPAPLDDVRVLDFTVMLAGPFATMMLGDYGAEIIKIEEPSRGDLARTGGPFLPQDTQRKAGGFFLSINRNKKSITLNLKHPQAVEIVKELVKVADVVMENFRPGVMDRLGLGYEALSEVNPKIVYTSISGFGRTGPYRDRPSFDLVAQAMGGVMSITGPKGGPPCKFGPGIGDIWPASMAAFTTMAALHRAKSTGEGQHVDAAMYDSMVYMMERALMMYSLAGIVSQPEGNTHPLYAPYDCFQTRDNKYLVIAGHWDKQWAGLCRTMEMEHLIEDPRFRTVPDRANNYGELRPIVEQWTVSSDRDDLVNRLLANDVPCGPVNTVEDIHQCPQAAQRNMLVEVPHPLGEPFKIAGVPVKLSKTPGSLRSEAPRLGEHNREVYGELLGYDAARVRRLKEEGII
jgi:crotonobetainyl-CoA:carnitine CoA-transferase CaiB-like acyl-CoA transferase